MSTPGSPDAGQFLLPTQFRNRFSPSPQDVSAVTAWLKEQGFSVGYTSLSSPLLAGMLALAVQGRGEPFGLANPALYAIAASGAYYDITKTDKAAYPGAVRADYINGVDATLG